MLDFVAAKNAFDSGDAGGLTRILAAGCDSQDSFANFTGAFVRLALHGQAVDARLPDDLKVYVDTMEETRRRLAGAVSVPRPHRVISHQHGFVADTGGVSSWKPIQVLNRLVMDQLVPRKKLAVVGTMRNDGIYLLEWVAHYLALGFEHVFCYTNDNADGSDELLAALARHGVVTIIQNELSPLIPPESKAFGHAMNLLHELREYEWALFVDSDEFLELPAHTGHKMSSVLDAIDNADPDKRIAAVLYDWLWYVSEFAFEKTPGILLERFSHAREHWLGKCLVRTKNVYSMRQQHHAELPPGYVHVDSALTPIDQATIWDRRAPNYAGGRLNHYWPRSFQEFAIKKARGATLNFKQNFYDRPYTTFFSWNGYESADAFYPADNGLIAAVKTKIAELRTVPEIVECDDRIQANFPKFLAGISSDEMLRTIYRQNRAEPGPL